ncbi:MAG: glycosyltransferase [Acidobacteria bacterium]|nr:glycosyltransferase [Acidobacteriota bacterium]
MKRERIVQAFFYNNPDNYPPIINGARLLAEAGWRVELCCRDDGKEWNVTYPEGVKIKRIRGTSGSSWRNYLSFCRQAMAQGKKGAAVFVGHDMHGLVPARLLAARYRRPLVYHCYDYSGDGFTQTFGSRLVKNLQFGFARKADLVTVPDEGLAQILSKDLHLKRQPVVMVNSPLDQPHDGGALRCALRDRGRHYEKIVFRQGRIGRGHALEVTIRSIPMWANRKWGFVVMGIGEASYVDSLNELAASLGVKDQFVALPPVTYDQVPEFTRDADVGHALYEPIHVNNLNITGSCKIQEYMAAGLPLMVSDRPSLRSLVEKHASGVAADDNSPESIAAAVNSLLTNLEASHEMGASSRRAFEREFCYEKQFAPVIQAIERLSKQLDGGF